MRICDCNMLCDGRGVCEFFFCSYNGNIYIIAYKTYEYICTINCVYEFIMKKIKKEINLIRLNWKVRYILCVSFYDTTTTTTTAAPASNGGVCIFVYIY